LQRWCPGATFRGRRGFLPLSSTVIKLKNEQ